MVTSSYCSPNGRSHDDDDDGRGSWTWVSVVRPVELKDDGFFQQNKYRNSLAGLLSHGTVVIFRNLHGESQRTFHKQLVCRKASENVAGSMWHGGLKDWCPYLYLSRREVKRMWYDIIGEKLKIRFSKLKTDGKYKLCEERYSTDEDTIFFGKYEIRTSLSQQI
ncbi:hypothetical protein LXL04_012338 [Taraxacum kok-saghyz]